MKNTKSPASNSKVTTDKENAVHNTSGAIMPDAQRRAGQNEKDVEAAFKDSSKTTKRDR